MRKLKFEDNETNVGEMVGHMVGAVVTLMIGAEIARAMSMMLDYKEKRMFQHSLATVKGLC